MRLKRVRLSCWAVNLTTLRCACVSVYADFQNRKLVQNVLQTMGTLSAKLLYAAKYRLKISLSTPALFAYKFRRVCVLCMCMGMWVMYLHETTWATKLLTPELDSLSLCSLFILRCAISLAAFAHIWQIESNARLFSVWTNVWSFFCMQKNSFILECLFCSVVLPVPAHLNASSLEKCDWIRQVLTLRINIAGTTWACGFVLRSTRSTFWHLKAILNASDDSHRQIGRPQSKIQISPGRLVVYSFTSSTVLCKLTAPKPNVPVWCTLDWVVWVSMRLKLRLPLFGFVLCGERRLAQVSHPWFSALNVELTVTRIEKDICGPNTKMESPAWATRKKQ